MNEEQMRDLVKECGLDWQRGYVALFDADDTNRYAVLIGAAVAAERERCAKACAELCDEVGRAGTLLDGSDAHAHDCANAIRQRFGIKDA